MKKFIPAAGRNRTEPHLVDCRADRRIRPGYDRLTTIHAHPARRVQYARICTPHVYGIRSVELSYWRSVARDQELAPALRDYAELALLEILAVVA